MRNLWKLNYFYILRAPGTESNFLWKFDSLDEMRGKWKAMVFIGEKCWYYLWVIYCWWENSTSWDNLNLNNCHMFKWKWKLLIKKVDRISRDSEETHKRGKSFKFLHNSLKFLVLWDSIFKFFLFNETSLTNGHHNHVDHSFGS